MKNEQRQQIREALALLNSMVACGEDHTDTSRAALEKAISALNAEQQSQVAPVAWYLPDDNGEPFRATCYQTEAQGWESAGHAPLPLYAAPHCLHEELESTKRMFHAACADLGQINEALGLDPDDGGAEPILDAIEELKQQLAAQPAPAVQEDDGFRGDNAALCASIDALISLNDEGALVPHGIGGHARGLLFAAANRLRASHPAPAQTGEKK